MQIRSLLVSTVTILSALQFAPGTASAGLVWTQAGGTSGGGGAGAQINSFVTGGADGSVTFVANGTILSHGSVTDGTRTVDYAVRFLGGQNPMLSDTVNNAFVVHDNNTADFFSASFDQHGSVEPGTFADNGSASIGVSFFDSGTFDSGTGTGTATTATFSMVAVNVQPNIYPGGSQIRRLSSSEFYDLDWGGGGAPIEIDPNDQILLDSTLSLNRLANYDPNRLPIGSTGITDPGTGGFTDPLTGDVRLEFNVNHLVSGADWEVILPEASTFTITRSGDDGQRSGIGFGGAALTSTPEPSSAVLTMLLGLASIGIRRRSS